MKIYQVGGCVRDRLLGVASHDLDYVVVGATPADMVGLGYRPVGRGFPVFLHPVTGCEHALARTERKQGHGYRGFAVECDPAVSLREDLERRDLTINALAWDPERGELIDYFGGERDLREGILRHISPAFGDDPLRVLRVARFAARLGFTIAPATLELLRKLTASGELATLTPERVWREVEQALDTRDPARFFRVLAECGAVAVLFPELHALVGVEQPVEYHPEGDVWNHALLSLEQAARLSGSLEVRFAALVHDLGKGSTPRALWPHHYGHDLRGPGLVAALCARLRAPRRYVEFGQLAARYHMVCQRGEELRPGKVLKLFAATHALQRPERFRELLLVCRADRLGRDGTAAPDMAGARLERYLERLLQLDPREVIMPGMSGVEIAERIRRQRLQLLAGLRVCE